MLMMVQGRGREVVSQKRLMIHVGLGIKIR